MEKFTHKGEQTNIWNINIEWKYGTLKLIMDLQSEKLNVERENKVFLKIDVGSFIESPCNVCNVKCI